jgi:hypothetical protein
MKSSGPKSATFCNIAQSIKFSDYSTIPKQFNVITSHNFILRFENVTF